MFMIPFSSQLSFDELNEEVCSKRKGIVEVEYEEKIHHFVEQMFVFTRNRAGGKSSIHASLCFCTVYAQGKYVFASMLISTISC